MYLTEKNHFLKILVHFEYRYWLICDSAVSFVSAVFSIKYFTALSLLHPREWSPVSTTRRAARTLSPVTDYLLTTGYQNCQAQVQSPKGQILVKGLG